MKADACITGLSRSGRCGAAYYCDEPHNCCASCKKDCNSRCGWIDKQKERGETAAYGDVSPSM